MTQQKAEGYMYELQNDRYRCTRRGFYYKCKAWFTVKNGKINISDT